MLGLTCHRCTQPGHGWRECPRPPARNRGELEARITDIVNRWDAGNGPFGRAVKTTLIGIETTAYDRQDAGKARTA